MSKTRASAEGQLERAKQSVEAREGVLQEKGVEFRRDTVWRSLNADVRKINARLRAISKIEERERDLIARKSGAGAEEE